MIPAELLQRIPGYQEGQPGGAVRPLPGGRGCNQVVRVDTRDGRFVLRRRHPPVDRPGSRALTELQIHRLAAAAGLAPRLLDAAPDASWLLMEFAEGRLWDESRLLSTEGVNSLGEQLAQLHALPVPADLPRFEAAQVARGYAQTLLQTVPQQVGQYAALVSRIDELSVTIAGFSGLAAINHGDLQLGNMIGAAPLLLDWEYAQVVDPTYDIACVLTYYPALEPQRDRLLASAGLATVADRTLLGLQQERFSLLNRLWELAHGLKTG